MNLRIVIVVALFTTNAVCTDVEQNIPAQDPYNLTRPTAEKPSLQKAPVRHPLKSEFPSRVRPSINPPIPDKEQAENFVSEFQQWNEYNYGNKPGGHPDNGGGNNPGGGNRPGGDGHPGGGPRPGGGSRPGGNRPGGGNQPGGGGHPGWGGYPGGSDQPGGGEYQPGWGGQPGGSGSRDDCDRCSKSRPSCGCCSSCCSCCSCSQCSGARGCGCSSCSGGREPCQMRRSNFYGRDRYPRYADDGYWGDRWEDRDNWNYRNYDSDYHYWNSRRPDYDPYY